MTTAFHLFSLVAANTTTGVEFKGLPLSLQWDYCTSEHLRFNVPKKAKVALSDSQESTLQKFIVQVECNCKDNVIVVAIVSN